METTDKTIILENQLTEVTICSISLEELKALQNSNDSISKDNLCLVLSTDTNIDEIPTNLTPFSWIAIHYPTYKDGRGHSIARTLRELKGYQGNILATGEILADHLVYLNRCGFNAFEPDSKENTEVCLSLLQNAFDFPLQGDATGNQPIYLKRSQ